VARAEATRIGFVNEQKHLLTEGISTCKSNDQRANRDRSKNRNCGPRRVIEIGFGYQLLSDYFGRQTAEVMVNQVLRMPNFTGQIERFGAFDSL
jgi:hypothetical protein